MQPALPPTNRAVPAPLGLRWAAGLVDLVLLAAVGNLVGLTVLEVAETRTGGPTALALAGVSVLVTAGAYFAVGEGRWGTTLGKLALGLQVLGDDGRLPGWRRGLLRFVVRLVGTGIAGAGWWLALGGRDRKAGLPWHDALTRTRVVRWQPWRAITEANGR